MAFATSAGDDPAVHQIGCGDFNDMNDGLKYGRDDKGVASALKIFSQ